MITIIQNQHAQGTSVASLSDALSGVASGNTLAILAWWHNANGAANAVSDTPSNPTWSYTGGGIGTNDGVTSHATANVASGAHNISYGWPGNGNEEMHVFELSGMPAALSIVGATTASGNSGTPNPGAITLTSGQVPAILIAYCQTQGGGGNPTAGSPGYTFIPGSGAVPGALQCQVVASAGTYQTSFTAPSGAWVAGAFALVGTAGGGGGVVLTLSDMEEGCEYRQEPGSRLWLPRGARGARRLHKCY